MRRLLCAGLVCTAIFALVTDLRATVMPAPGAFASRIADADCVIVGKVTSIEDKMVMNNRIAVVQISEALAGAKGLTHIRVAFQERVKFRLPPPPKPGQAQPQPVLRPAPIPGFTLTVGQEGIFILKKQPGENYYASPGMWNFIAKTDPNFEKRLASIKRIAKLRDDPAAGLKSKSADERLTAAVILLSRYNRFVGPKSKRQPIDAAQSKLILEALAEGEWNQNVGFQEVSASQGFNQLRLTAQDGWTPPQQQPNQDYRIFQANWEAAARKWLKDHAATYRVQQNVAEK